MAEPGSKANHRLEHGAGGRAQGGCEQGEQGADAGQGCGAGGTVTFLSCSRSFGMSGEGAQCTHTHTHTRGEGWHSELISEESQGMFHPLTLSS